MIKIYPIKNENYNNGFIVEGHAEYSMAGTDIVCSAISSAVLMLETQLKYLSQRGGLDILTEIDDDGNFKVILDLYAVDGGMIESVIQGFHYHVTLIAKQYPDNVTVEEWII